MPYIYIISSAANKTRYKVGRHTGTYSKLCSRYRTSIPDLIVHDFIECSDPISTEKEVLTILDRYRIPHTSSGRQSEWVQCSLMVIRKAITTATSHTHSDTPKGKGVPNTCSALTKKGRPCRNKGTNKKDNRYYCGIHIKNVPTDDTTWLSKLLSKLKI